MTEKRGHKEESALQALVTPNIVVRMARKVSFSRTRTSPSMVNSNLNVCFVWRTLDLSFFDPSCAGCSAILKSRETRLASVHLSSNCYLSTNCHLSLNLICHPTVICQLNVICRLNMICHLTVICQINKHARFSSSSIGHILAIMRQWVPQTQHAIDTFVTEIIKRGAHPDDRYGWWWW